MYLANTLLFLSFIVLSFSISCQFHRKVKDSYGSLVFGAVFLFLMILIPLCLNIFFGEAYSVKIHSTDVIKGSWVYFIYAAHVFIFSLFYFLVNTPGLLGRPYSPKSLNKVLFSGQKYRFMHFSSGVFCIVGVLFFIKGTGMGLEDLLYASRFGWFLEEDFSPLVLNFGLYLISLISVFCYLDFRMSFPKKWLSLAVYASVLFIIIVAGGRKWLIFAASGFLAAYYDQSNGKFKMSLKFILYSGLTLFIAIFWQYIRSLNFSQIDSFLYVVEGMFAKNADLLLKGDISYFYRASLEAINLNLNEGLLQPFAVVRRLLFLPIPTEWTFGLKPEGVAVMFSDVLDAGSSSRRGNMPPGLIGLFVLSFGSYASIFISSAGLVAAMSGVDYLLANKNNIFRVVLIANVFVISILMMRGSEDSVYWVVSNMLVMGCFSLLYGLLKIVSAKKTREAS